MNLSCINSPKHGNYKASRYLKEQRLCRCKIQKRIYSTEAINDQFIKSLLTISKAEKYANKKFIIRCNPQGNENISMRSLNFYMVTLQNLPH